MNAHRDGLTLIEVLAALAILGIAVAAWTTLVGQDMRSTSIARARVAQIDEATKELSSLQLLSRAELDARRGEFNERGFVIEIQEISPALFDVRISNERSATLLRTSLYCASHAIP